jgi:hypothetical protein
MAGFLSLLLLASVAADAHPARLVGQYEASRMELAAALELSADGRFRYALSYGALDEQAAGTWHAEGARVLLDSDPIKSPRFTMLSQSNSTDKALHVSLQLPPGLDPQYFNALVELTDGHTLDGQLSEEGLSLALAPDQHPARLRILLPVFEIASDPIAVDPAKGLSFRFRFDPNDLGRVRFTGTPLAIDKDQLILARHGIELHFQSERRADH